MQNLNALPSTVSPKAEIPVKQFFLQDDHRREGFGPFASEDAAWFELFGRPSTQEEREEAANAGRYVGFVTNYTEASKLKPQLSVSKPRREPPVFGGMSKDDLKEVMAFHGVGLQRTNQAINLLHEGENPRVCVDTAVANEARARGQWVDKVLKPWCARHGLTIEQALSVAFDDGAYNPTDPRKDQVTMTDLMSWNGQEGAFATYLRHQLKEQVPLAELGVSVAIAQSNDLTADPIMRAAIVAYEATDSDHLDRLKSAIRAALLEADTLRLGQLNNPVVARAPRRSDLHLVLEESVCVLEGSVDPAGVEYSRERQS